MNQSIKQNKINAIAKGIRLDGRSIHQVRPITVKTGVVSTADGSAQVSFGDTEVIAGVKLAVEKPFPDTPEDGVLMVNAELLPLSNPKYESGPPGINAIELSRVVDRGIREGGAIDTKKLCLEKGEKVWSVIIDVVPLNDDGNLLDVAGFAALCALKNTVFPEYDGEKVIFEKKTDKKLDLVKEPIPITLRRLNNVILVDPTEEEEELADARLTVTMLSDGKVCSLQKGGDAPLTEKEVGEMFALADQVNQEVRKQLP